MAGEGAEAKLFFAIRIRPKGEVNKRLPLALSTSRLQPARSEKGRDFQLPVGAGNPLPKSRSLTYPHNLRIKRFFPCFLESPKGFYLNILPLGGRGEIWFRKMSRARLNRQGEVPKNSPPHKASMTERNQRRREHYAERTGKAKRDRSRAVRDFAIAGDREAKGLSLRAIAKKRGLSVGAIRAVLKAQLRSEKG